MTRSPDARTSALYYRIRSSSGSGVGHIQAMQAGLISPGTRPGTSTKCSLLDLFGHAQLLRDGAADGRVGKAVPDQTSPRTTAFAAQSPTARAAARFHQEERSLSRNAWKLLSRL